MPNWCYNYTEISGPKEEIKRLYEAMEQGKFFAYMSPEPDYSVTPVAPAFPDISGTNEATVSDNSWWDWRVQNWGTKWEVDEADLKTFEYSEHGETARLAGNYSTAWSPGLEAFAEYLRRNEDADLSIRSLYYEPGCGFAGTWENGDDDCRSLIDMNLKKICEQMPEIAETFGLYAQIDEDEIDEDEDEIDQ